MEIKLNEFQMNEIKMFLESILVEEHHGMELIERGMYINDGCESVLRARNKWSGAIGILSNIGISVDVGEYNEVTLKKGSK